MKMEQKILIVDDEAHIRMLIEQTLEELEDEGVEFLTAENGEIALDIIQKEKIIKVGYPTFVGFTLKNLYDFFMLFVILCGLAGLILLSLTPMLKKMMHGIK